MDEFSEIMNHLSENHKSFLIPSDFDFLSRGGRLTPLAAKIAGLIKIVPVMTQTPDGKRLESAGIKRTMKKAVEEAKVQWEASSSKKPPVNNPARQSNDLRGTELICENNKLSLSCIVCWF